MSNRVSLLNTKILSSDVNALYAKSKLPGGEMITFAEAGNRIPIPWLCCFRKEDLRTVSITVTDGDGFDWLEPDNVVVATGTLDEDGHFQVEEQRIGLTEEEKAKNAETRPQEILLPCTTVEQALVNLERALPTIESIAGDATTAREYFDEMAYYLRALPFPYLTADLPEVMCMIGYDEAGEALTSALSTGDAAIPQLKLLSGFVDGVAPYSREVFLNIPGPCINEDRANNASAMYCCPDTHYWHLPEGSEQPAHVLPEFEPSGDEIRISRIVEQLANAAKSVDQSSHVSCGFTPESKPGDETLSVCIHVDTDVGQIQLTRDRAFRSNVDNHIHNQFSAWCERHGFGFQGIIVVSKEHLDNNLNGDYAACHSLPALRRRKEPESFDNQHLAALERPMYMAGHVAIGLSIVGLAAGEAGDFMVNLAFLAPLLYIAGFAFKQNAKPR